MIDIRKIPSEVDLRLNLLSGDPMATSYAKVTPLTVKQVKDIGYDEYTKCLSLLTIDKKDIIGNSREYDDLSIVDIVIRSGNQELIDAFGYALSVFLLENLEDLLINERYGFVFGGLRLDRGIESCIRINGDNFQDIIQILKYQNCLVGTNEQYIKPNPANDKASKIQAKLKKAKESVSRAKSKGSDSNIDFADIVSAVSTKSNTYNKHNVWDLTIYQLYDEYKRMEQISSYENSIMAMLQGAKIENLKHWSAKID